MENNTSILQPVELNSVGAEQIKSSGKWAKFIGIVFVALAILTTLLFISIITNIDKLKEMITEKIGMSDLSYSQIESFGLIALAILYIVFITVFVLNAFFLIRFRNGSENYFLTGNEDELANSFNNLGKYFKISVALGILSTIGTLIAVVITFFTS
jgi:hypothetical protein